MLSLRRRSNTLLPTLLAIGLLLFQQLAAAAGTALPMWEIRDAKSQGTVYLFGSIHVCTEACLDFPPTVLKRFSQSKALLVELDPEDAGNQGLLISAMTLPTGQSLDNKLTPARRGQLSRVAQTLGLPTELFAPLKPVMAATMLEMYAAEKSGFSLQNGIDMWFIREARSQGKPVIALETMDEQIAALQAGTEKEQIAGLGETLDLIESKRYEPLLSSMLSAWQSGNLPEVDRITRESMAGEKYSEDALLTKRNAGMARKLEARLRQGEQLFVVIGTAHIAGKGNVAELLGKRGFTLRQLHTDD